MSREYVPSPALIAKHLPRSQDPVLKELLQTGLARFNELRQFHRCFACVVLDGRVFVAHPDDSSKEEVEPYIPTEWVDWTARTGEYIRYGKMGDYDFSSDEDDDDSSSSGSSSPRSEVEMTIDVSEPVEQAPALP